MQRITSLYIHIPFCMKKCRYCDFNSIVSDGDVIDRYIDAIEREMHLRGRGYVFKTIYIGGGTPTILDGDQLKRLLNIINRHVDPQTLVEYTIEANPCSINLDKVGILRENLVNRVSLGIQSFNDTHLRFLGRIHTSNDAFQAFSMLRGHGFANINIDLIFGIPSQGLEGWEDDLNMAVSLRPEHVSTYSLSYEEGTVLNNLLLQGEIQRMDESDELRMYRTAIDTLTRDGFEHYEVSNFARKGRRCIHNMVYWKNEGYIGIGAGAFSFIHSRREANETDVLEYIKDMMTTRLPDPDSTATGGRNPPFHERLSPAGYAAETLIMGLRMRAGISDKRFYRQTGYSLGDLYSSQLTRLARAGLISLCKGRLRLTKKGLYVADSVMAEFLD